MLHRNIFNEAISNMIVLLNRVVGNQTAEDFQDWMFLYISTITTGKQFIDWGEMISDALHHQLTGFNTGQGFYMSSYLMYTIASMKSWPGLNPYGEYNLTTQIYNYYPQLQLKQSNAHFRRVNDAFSMLTAREI